MTSMIRLLKGLWSGSRNDSERDAASIPRQGSTPLPSPHAHSTGTPVVTATPELPVSTGTTPSSFRGTVTIHHGTMTYTGVVDLFSVGETSLSTTVHANSSLAVTSNDNITRTRPRDITADPAVEYEDAPELEAAPNFPNTTATTFFDGPRLTQGNRHSPLASVSGRSGRRYHNTERGSSSASRTARGSSPPENVVVHLAQLPAASSNRSVTLDAEPRYKPKPEPQSARVFDAERWTREFGSGTNCFNPALIDSPPTPPRTSAPDDSEPLTSTAVKRERSPSVVLPTRTPNVFPPSVPQHQVKDEPEMEQIAPRTPAIAQAMITPSKPARGSSHASSAMMTPPNTTSARKTAVASSSRHPDTSDSASRVQSLSPPPSPCPDRAVPAPTRHTRSTTPSSASKSRNSVLIQTQANGWDAPSPSRSTRTISPLRGTASQASASQVQTATGRPFRPPVQEDPTMEWTSIRELVAAPLVNGRRIMPRYGPPCLSCGVRLVYRGTTGSGKNKGRPFYKCPTNRHGFGTFADLEGEEEEGGICCDCPGRPLARRTERNDGTGFFWKCLELRCEFK